MSTRFEGGVEVLMVDEGTKPVVVGCETAVVSRTDKLTIIEQQLISLSVY